MRNIFLITRIVANRFSQHLKWHFVATMIGGIAVIVLSMGNYELGTYLRWPLVASSFGLIYYMCVKLDHRHFEIHFLSRQIKRGEYFAGALLACSLPALSLFALVILASMREFYWHSVAEAFSMMGMLMLLAFLDVLLFVAIVFALRLMGYSAMCLNFAVVPFLLSFKGPNIGGYVAINYSLPHVLSAGNLTDLLDGHAFTGGTIHIFSNLLTAALIVYLVDSHYLTKDLA